jgi:hypothetical protein
MADLIPPGASADLSVLDGHLRAVRRLCLALLALVAGCAGLAGWLASRARGRPIPGVAENVPVFLALFAAAAILLSSRMRTTVLRRALPRTPGLLPSLERLLPAYRTATLTSFALLALASLVGPLVAVISGRAFYGWVLCGASSFAMLTRWPRAEEVDRLLRGRAKP